MFSFSVSTQRVHFEACDLNNRILEIRYQENSVPETTVEIMYDEGSIDTKEKGSESINYRYFLF